MGQLVESLRPFKIDTAHYSLESAGVWAAGVVDENLDINHIGQLPHCGFQGFSALYAGITTAMRFPLIMRLPRVCPDCLSIQENYMLPRSRSYLLGYRSYPLSERVWRKNGIRRKVGLHQPDMPVLVILDQFAIAGYIHFARPDHLGSTNVRSVVDPLIHRIVAGRVTNNRTLQTRNRVRRSSKILRIMNKGGIKTKPA
jgi:hypothetical protein